MRVRIGSRISIGQLVAHRRDRVADLVGRLDHVLLEVEDDDDRAPMLSLAVERIW